MGYIYQADVYCSTCGYEIRKRLKAEGKAPKDPKDEYSYDSDEYPKRFYEAGECVDSPAHCGSGEDCPEAYTLPSGRKIGALLDCELTADGIQYVKEAVAEGGEVAEYWADCFSDDLS